MTKLTTSLIVQSERMLILAPTVRDAKLSKTVLTQAGIICEVVTSLNELCTEMAAGAGAAMLTEESVESGDGYKLLATLQAQEPWSDFPMLIMTKGGADSSSAAQALDWLGNIILLERPVRINTLVSAARAALRARRRQYQIQSHLLAHELAEAALREKGELLMEQTERLFSSNKELEQFAYVSSHDLQEPLRKISTFAQIVTDRFGDKLDDDGKRYLNIVSSSADRMTSLIRDLLTYARLSGKDQLSETIELRRPLENVINDLDLLIQEKKAVITIDTLPSVIANSTRLHHVFLNLLSNAIKFQGQEAPRVHISATQTGDFAQVSIQDNGIGIEPKYAQQIFQVFQRLHVRSKYQGNGIGLAICKKIIEQHRGKIWVESQADQGATFYFTLPLAKSLN